MACPCRALRGLTLARAPFPRPALLAHCYRAYSTGPSDPPFDKGPESTPNQGSQPNEKPTTSDTPPRRHSEPSEKPTASDRPGSEPRPTFDSYTSEAPPKERRRRTIGPQNPEPREKQHWQAQKDALRRKFPMGWAPPKKLSPDALSGMRALHAQFPQTYTTPVLSNLFAVSPEAVRRILKGKWAPVTSEAEEERRARWVRRGERVWERWAGLGLKVPTKWRPEGVSKWGGRVQGTKGEEGHEGEGGRTDKKGVGRNFKARRRVTRRIM